jgi:nitrogen fixation protein FixH
MTTAAASKFRRLTGLHVLAIVLVFFGAVIGINVIFITEALKSFPGEDEVRSYAQGLKYNATLADRAQQAALGWRASARLTPDADGARVEIQMTDRDGAALDNLSLTGTLRRPVDAREDVVFVPKGHGRYVAAPSSIAPGQWALRADARNGRDHIEIVERMQWPTPAP